MDTRDKPVITDKTHEPFRAIASNKIAIGVGALGVFLFATVALAQHEQNGRIARQDAEVAREGSAPGPAARRGEPTTFDAGEATNALEGRLWQAGRACGASLKPGTTVKVHATVQPTGHVGDVSVLSGGGSPQMTSCLADALNDTTVSPFRGEAGTIEPELVVQPR